MLCILIQGFILYSFPVSFKICQFHRMGRYFFCDVTSLLLAVCMVIIECDQERTSSFEILSAVAKWYAIQCSRALPLFHILCSTVL